MVVPPGSRSQSYPISPQEHKENVTFMVLFIGWWAGAAAKVMATA
jgi:hypothetical protein